jgi:hypothetical protein
VCLYLNRPDRSVKARPTNNPATVSNEHKAGAIELARLGLLVFPLRPSSKEPYPGRSWLKDRSADPETVARRFDKRPGCNVAIATRPALFAVDLDVKAGGIESFERLKDGRELPETATTRTGSGGRHHYFRAPGGVGCCNGLKPGIDVKGRHGYVVAPPSLHPSGTSYTWERHPGDGVADAPAWLLEALGSERGRKSYQRQEQADAADDKREPLPDRLANLDRAANPATLIEAAIRNYPVAAIGTRNGVMARLIGSLVGRRFNPELIVDVVEAWWVHHHNLGVIGTNPRESRDRASEAIRSMLRSAGFIWHPSQAEHIEAIASQQLDEAVVSGLSLKVSDLQSRAENPPPPAPRSPIGIDSHLISERQCDWGRRVCETADEVLFVTAWLCLAKYQAAISPGGILTATDAMIRDVANRRAGPIGWHDQTINRLKRRYVARLGKPATRLELLDVMETGRRGKSGQPGTPSIYRPTGLLVIDPTLSAID